MIVLAGGRLDSQCLVIEAPKPIPRSGREGMEGSDGSEGREGNCQVVDGEATLIGAAWRTVATWTGRIC